MPTRLSSTSDLLPEGPDRVNLLQRSEQELLARILQHAESLSAAQAELLPLVQKAVARAVGEVLLQRSAEEVGIEIVEILKKQGPHPPKAEPILPDTGPHPPKPPLPPGPGTEEPLTGPHPPKPPGPGSAEPVTGPHPPKPTGPPGPGQVKPLTGPHPPKPPTPPGPGQVQPGKVPVPNKQPARKPLSPPQGPHPPKPPGPGATAKKTMGNAIESPVELREYPQEMKAVFATAEEFLMPSELRDLMRFTLAHELDFEISEVVSPGVTSRGSIDEEYRRSRVLMRLAEHEERLLERIRGLLPRVFRKLKMPPFEPGRAEVQITASNHGDFFRDHSDNGHPEIASRALTFVYFFHTEPKPFRGGELRLYDSRFNGEYFARAGASRVIVPEQNQMVFFPSELVHEIRPVECPSQKFEHSRFTVNGWLHRR
jgi:hypothetical protein